MYIVLDRQIERSVSLLDTTTMGASTGVEPTDNETGTPDIPNIYAYENNECMSTGRGIEQPTASRGSKTRGRKD